MTNTDASELRHQMADALVARGQVRSDAWRRAVERVPRHVLVPCFFEWENGKRILVNEQDERWSRAIYDPDETLVTEYDDGGWPSSSATMPSMVLAMLEALDVQERQRVLDVGTGSGYSAALLCELVGSENVTSIDAGAEVVRLARERLQRAGYKPAVILGDGFDGYAPNAPYDRIVSMVRVRRVPSRWVEQTRPGGVILATLSGATVRLTRRDDGSASGAFPLRYSFMPMRGHSPARIVEPDEMRALLRSEGATVVGGARLQAMWRSAGLETFWTVCRLLLLPYERTIRLDDGRVGLADESDRSWVLIDEAGDRITQGGPRRVWDEMAAIYDVLAAHDMPGFERFGLTVRPDGSQLVWLDAPDSEYQWKLHDWRD